MESTFEDPLPSQDNDSIYETNTQQSIPLLKVHTHEQTFIKPGDPSPNINKVIYLGFCFLILYTAFSGAQTLMAEIYQQLGYTTLGKINMLTMYAVYCCSALIAPGLIKDWTYKTGIFVGSLGFIFTLVAGVMTTSCYPSGEYVWCESVHYILAINIVCSTLNGFTAPILWLSVNSYITGCANESNKGRYMGIFFSFVFTASLTGGLTAAVIIEHFGQFIFFLIACILACVAACMIVIVPDIPKYGQVQNADGVMTKMAKMARLGVGRPMLPLLPYMVMIGLSFAIYNLFESVLILHTIPNMKKENQNDITAIILIVEGAMTIVASYGAGKLADTLKRNVVLTIFNVSVFLAIVFSFITYYQKSLVCAYIMACFWGIAYSGAYTLIGAVMAKDFEGRLEAYGVVQFTLNVAIALGSVICIYVSNVELFLCIIFLFLVVSQISLLFYKQKV